jgi:nucleotide-binding universal stress UspA family protein
MSSPAGQRIVVGYDGSAAATAAVRWAVNEARTLRCPLEIVLAYDDSVPAMSFGMSTLDSLPSQRAIARRAHEAVQEVARRAAEPGLSVVGTAAAGRPGPALVAAAAGARLLVIGASHHSAVGRVLTGSTVTHCQRHAPCPVVVVRAEEPVRSDPVEQPALPDLPHIANA